MILFQRIFILNVAASDISMAVIGVLRGLGIVSKSFLGVSQSYGVGNFCYGITLLMNVFLLVNVEVNLP